MSKAESRKQSPQQKKERVDLRVTSLQKQVLMKAAELQQTSLSQFMVEKSCDAAQEIIQEQNRFVLDDAQWKAFYKALDAPPRKIPALQRLLTQSSVLD